MSVVRDVADLKSALGSLVPPVLLDVRWALGDTEGAQHYRDAHIPGAVFVDLEADLAEHGSPEHGRHPLPSIDDLQAAARRWGVSSRVPVVVYDNTGNLAAARAWWLLKWAGVEQVSLLDGGLRAWVDAGYETAAGDEFALGDGDIELSAGHLRTLTADQAEALAAAGTLLDARAAERFAGESEPIDPRAGHIPGAVSAPTTHNLDADGRFLPAEALRARFAHVAGEVGVYCGSGVTAAHQVAALAIAGIDAALYPGSWSQWSNDPDRPVATGR
ncbi:MAG: sulfurtransferase [Rhodococcus sp. (in: high G+C Gram-positive bacteria)]